MEQLQADRKATTSKQTGIILLENILPSSLNNALLFSGA